jgi:hypothetical protein
MKTYTKIKRTIQTLKNCYTNQHISKETVINCLNNDDFQTRYVNY